MKRAIVLAGGGAKGSYQLGVWRALKEKNIDYSIVVGNSIGSLNAALMVQQEYELAWELWNGITAGQVIKQKFKDVEDYEYYGDNRDQISSFFKKYLLNKGGDISAFIKVLDEYIHEEIFFRSKIDYGLMTVRFPSMEPHEVLKKDIKPGYLKKWIQASCAVFPALPMCKIGEESYVDGMYYDNVPVGTAFRLGADEVIVVALRPNISKKKYQGNPCVHFIEPSESLGAMLSFEHEGIQRNITRGYFDGMKFFGEFYGKKYTLKNLDQRKCKIIGRKILHAAMKNELENELVEAKLIKRNSSSIPLAEKIFQFSEKDSVGELDIFLITLEALLDINEFETEKVYDVKKILKNIEALTTKKINYVLVSLNNNKFTSEYMQKESADVMAGALLIYALKYQ